MTVETPPLSEPACVDRELWEKIVLNLLSNAFEHTFAGESEPGMGICGHNSGRIRASACGSDRDGAGTVIRRYRLGGLPREARQSSGAVPAARELSTARSCADDDV